jgi:pyridoxamine 5'-phosphate oxidase
MPELPAERRDYQRMGLTEAELDPDPIAQLHRWLADAQSAGVEEPSAMTLATADARGRPSARIVLLRGLDAGGLTWFTNYGSPKGRDLDANPRAALVFHWQPLERQVRVEGPVARLSPAASDAYFAGRPRGSQVAAWASGVQSSVVADRAALEAAFAAEEARFEGDDVPRPPEWGGYRLTPEMFEFWQGRRNRQHDRLQVRRDGGAWRVVRLSP